MGLALYVVNNLLLKPLASTGLLGAFVRGHLNDVLAGLAFMAYTNLLFDLVRPERRLARLWVMLAYMLCCGLFWEGVAPTLLKPSVSDPWDVVSYLAGAALYWAVGALRDRCGRSIQA